MPYPNIEGVESTVYTIDDLVELQIKSIQNQTDYAVVIIVLFGVLIAMLAGSLFFKLVFRDVR